jgi:hypothetical protein
MKQKYRIYVIGDVPADLKEKIMAGHVAGILKGKGEGKPIQTRVSVDQKRAVLSIATASMDKRGNNHN